jgi:peroxiredoxin Q/BCP
VVIGVSPDKVKDQAKFKAKEKLPFILLADENHKVAEKYGVWVEKSPRFCSTLTGALKRFSAR